MVRYLLTAAGTLAMMSSFAFAATDIPGSTTTTITQPVPHETKTITRPARHAMNYHEVIIKHPGNRYGNLVTKKKTTTDGLSGSSVTRTRMTTDRGAGGTVTKSHTTTDLH